jgi:DNA-binding NtrC family response regulator
MRLVGASPQIQSIQKLLQLAAATDVPVIIYGERGTGRETVARILYESAGQTGRFERLTCSGLSDELVTAELERRIALADGGTVFIDDINDLPPDAQDKLERFVETRVFGSISANVRLIASSNRPLDYFVEGGAFSSALHQRLLGIRLTLPPLRERKADIPLLADHFVQTFAAQFSKPVRGLHPAVLKRLAAYDWPGNVQEFKDAIECAVQAAQHDILTLEDFSLVPVGITEEPAPAMIPGSTIQEIERQAILRTLEHVGGSTTLAAKMLNMSVRKIQYKLKEYRAAGVEIEVPAKVKTAGAGA